MRARGAERGTALILHISPDARVEQGGQPVIYHKIRRAGSPRIYSVHAGAGAHRTKKEDEPRGKTRAELSRNAAFM